MEYFGGLAISALMAMLSLLLIDWMFKKNIFVNVWIDNVWIAMVTTFAIWQLLVTVVLVPFLIRMGGELISVDLWPWIATTLSYGITFYVGWLFPRKGVIKIR